MREIEITIMFSLQCILDDLLRIVEYFNYSLLQSILRLGHQEQGDGEDLKD